MSQDNYYDEMLDIFGIPQRYKDVSFRCLKIKEYKTMRKMQRLFGFPKKYFSSKDPILMKMGYLKFLLTFVSYLSGGETNILQELTDVLEIVTDEKVEIQVFGDTTNIDSFDYLLFIGGKKFISSDFDIIRDIILRQNGSSLNYVESYREDFEEMLEWQNRNKENYNLKDQIFSFAALMGKTISEIEDISFYEMYNTLQALGSIEVYRVHRIPVEYMGKDYKMPSFLTHFEDVDRYKSIKVNVNNFKKDSTYFKSEKEIGKKQGGI